MTRKKNTQCRLVQQGYDTGSCLVKSGRRRQTACTATLRRKDGSWERLISSIQLSRPENYLSIYQSGCNLSCRKCHSWYFSRIRSGEWFGPEQILEFALEYQKNVTLVEPRHKATAWHAHDTCRCCGECVLTDTPSPRCPGVLAPKDIRAGPQGFGPVRNILGFTGGDLTCRPEFYADCTRLIKEKTDLWVLVETNGYGLTESNLDILKEAGVDSYWLDIKAFDAKKHEWLTGRTNKEILGLPERILAGGFVLEVLSLYIPGLVETEELHEIARLLSGLDSLTPFTILAFFPEHLMKEYRSPTVDEMVKAYEAVASTGLQRVRLGNTGLVARSADDRAYLAKHLPIDAY